MTSVGQGMIEYLFGSKTRLKLLQIFYGEPEARFFVRELSRLTDTQINAIRRELSNLVATTVIREDADTGEKAARRKFYSLNRLNFSFHPPRRKLFKNFLNYHNFKLF